MNIMKTTIKEFLNEELIRGKYLYGILKGDEIINTVVAPNVESAYKKYKNFSYNDEIKVSPSYDRKIDGVVYKTYFAYQVGNYSKSMVYLVLLDKG